MMFVFRFLDRDINSKNENNKKKSLFFSSSLITLLFSLFYLFISEKDELLKNSH